MHIGRWICVLLCNTKHCNEAATLPNFPLNTRRDGQTVSALTSAGLGSNMTKEKKTTSANEVFGLCALNLVSQMLLHTLSLIAFHI